MVLKGKVAIITGSGAGIGVETAIKLAAEGVRVCCNSVSNSAAKVADKIRAQGGEAIFVQADVSLPQDAQRLVAETVKNFGSIDILINNAGIVIPGTVENTTLDDWEKTFAVNIRSIFLVSQAALPHLKKTKGTIVNTSSVAALKGLKDRFAYSASKGAVSAASRAMATDLLKDGIRVNAVCPGTTYTPSLEERFSKFADYEKAKADFIARQPMGRLGEAGEIADAIIYLVKATFCTGIDLSPDGGMTM